MILITTDKSIILDVINDVFAYSVLNGSNRIISIVDPLGKYIPKEALEKLDKRSFSNVDEISNFIKEVERSDFNGEAPIGGYYFVSNITALIFLVNRILEKKK